jgi:cycloeucalenol cycloisomerase
MLTGALRQWDDATYLIFSTAIALPSLAAPALWRGGRRPWTRGYWFKLNLWVAIVVFFGTYFGSHYFFDLMGMRYAFDVRWTFDSRMLGHSDQEVPVFMYPLTHAFFMTYFVVLLEVERWMVEHLRPAFSGRIAIILGLSYVLAFLETFFMDCGLLSDLFSYEKHERMLLVGSLGYASYFVVGLPMVGRIDAAGAKWDLGRVIGSALSSCMAIMVLLEAWARFVGRL